MSVKSKQELLGKMRNLVVALQNLRKEITTNAVEGLGLVREDLEPSKRPKDYAHGQRHRTPIKKPNVSMPSGQGEFSQSEVQLDNVAGSET